MMSRAKARPTLEEYIQEQMNMARVLGNSVCVLFAKNESAMEAKLTEMKLSYTTPGVGCYFVSVK